MNETQSSLTQVAVNDIENEAERWEDVRTLILASNTITVKNLRNSGFARMVSGYLSDFEGEAQENWNGNDLTIQFGGGQ